MKYLFTNTKFEGFRVRVDASEEEQQAFGYLAENMLGDNVGTIGNKYPIPRVNDTPAGIVVRFESNKEFRKFLIWREIFNSRDSNKQFSFIPLARKAIQHVKKDIAANLIENIRGQTEWS